jgi:acyl-homoserine lactone acylase PvdQ
MKTIVIKWSTEDVLAMAESMDIELTETQADQILDNLLKYHDANVGINWDVINFHIEDYLNKI